MFDAVYSLFFGQPPDDQYLFGWYYGFKLLFSFIFFMELINLVKFTRSLVTKRS